MKCEGFTLTSVKADKEKRKHTLILKAEITRHSEAGVFILQNLKLTLSTAKTKVCTTESI